MKIYLILTVFLIAFATIAPAQEWSYVEDFTYLDYPHGVVVTPNGKIWVGIYGGSWMPTFPIYIFNADGSLHHTIETLTYDGNTENLADRCRGLSLDRDGNVLYTGWDKLWRINYQTYEAMNKVIPWEGVTLTEAACDRNGFIYITHVVPDGKPFYIYNKNFEFVGYVDESVYTIQRSVVVRPNGKDIFVGRIYGREEGNGIIHYHSDCGPYGNYTMEGIYQTDIWGQCLDVNFDGKLWVGSYWDVGPDELTGWYALDPLHNFEIVNQFGENVGMNPFEGPQPPIGGTYYAPRGAAWTPDRRTMYTADFDGSVIKKWTSGLKKPSNQGEFAEDENMLPKKFELYQNYPNPFNPETIIQFQLPEASHVELKIFNMLGEEVRTLVNSQYQAGHHTIKWDGTDGNGNSVSNGVYLYRIQAGSFSKIMKMSLLR